MSSKSASKVHLDDEILQKVKWRRVGVWFWTSLFALGLTVVLQMPLLLSFFVLVPLLLIRTHLITSSLLSHLGVRYNIKIALFFVDLGSFLVTLISYEWSLYVLIFAIQPFQSNATDVIHNLSSGDTNLNTPLNRDKWTLNSQLLTQPPSLTCHRPIVSEFNYMHYDASKDVNWTRVLAGRAGWACLASFLFHRHIRSFYNLIINSVLQRRMFRFRLAIFDAMKVSLRLIRSVIVCALALWLILQLFVNPVSYMFIGSAQSSERAEETEKHHSSQFAASDAHSAGSPSSNSASATQKSAESMRGRHRNTNANFLMTSAFHAFLGSTRFVLSNMNILSFSELSSRLFQILCLSFVLEMSWFISSIIFSERFSFLGFEDFSSTSRKSKSLRNARTGGLQHHSLLKSKHGNPDQLLKNFQGSAPASASSSSSSSHSPALMMIKCLGSQKPFISLLALQDLHYVAHHTPEMRAELYRYSSGTGENQKLGSDYGRGSSDSASPWEQLVKFAVTTLDATSSVIEKGIQKANGGDGKKEKGKSQSGSKAPLSLASGISALSSYRKNFDNKIREQFKWVRRDVVDISIESSLSSYTASPALVQHQMSIITLLKSVSRLISTSTKEDTNGTIASSQQTIPDLLNAMVHLYIVLQEYSQQMGSGKGLQLAKSSSKNISLQGHSIAFSYSTSLINALSESIYEITTVYYEHLILYSFSPDHLEVLQRFMDFTA